MSEHDTSSVALSQGCLFCSVEGCGRLVKARGWCTLHYLRWRRHRRLELRTPPDPVDRFWQKVSKTGFLHPAFGQCWSWLGNKNTEGYGRLGVERKVILAHRFSWMVHFGAIPNDLHVLHHCDNPECTNPNHLFLGDQAENIADMTRKGRQLKGEKIVQAKLTEKQVKEIRKRYRPHDSVNGGRSLAREFGVTQTVVSRLIRGLTWNHVCGE